MQLFKFLKASKFFPKYAPNVKQYRNKLCGSDSRKSVTFTNNDLKAIKEGLKVMIKENKI